MITLTGANHWKEVLESPIPFLVEIGADWCGTCDIMAPILERLAIEYEGKIRVGRLDIDTNEQVAREFGVTELPFLLLFKDGNLVDHVIGMVSATNLKARIQKLLEPRD
ncbi:MAG: thiol reductase thioredoxin [Aliifodinibius sp.]|nr:thiol reductase thioredoxin [Fodinibius sp.]NIV11658.1 thiol reductase thioredoxin [Fodinibius sp.]NIY25274.1 thiol reductase thioredoxin [Fodinibius sp.]